MPHTVRNLLQDVLDNSIPQVRYATSVQAMEGLDRDLRVFLKEPVSPIYVAEVRKHLSLARANLKTLGADMEGTKVSALKPINELDLVLSAFSDYFSSRSVMESGPPSTPVTPPAPVPVEPQAEKPVKASKKTPPEPKADKPEPKAASKSATKPEPKAEAKPPKKIKK